MQNLPDYATIYIPDESTEIRGTVQIIHGMAEHQRRYKDFSEFLKSSGYVVATSDLRGHGVNVKREADLGYVGDNGASNIVSDCHDMTKIICERCPNVPYVMIGHGMGALVAMAYFKKYDYFLNGLILSGMPADKSRMSDRLNVRMNLASKGEYYRSHSLYSSIYGSYANSFAKEGSKAAWLSADPEVWEAYDSDPRCGFVYTINGYKTYLDLLDNSYSRGSWILKNMHVPIRIIAGSRDVCAGNKHKLSRIASHFRAHEYDNVETQLIHGLRHDIYNGEGCEKAYDYILNELDKISQE